MVMEAMALLEVDQEGLEAEMIIREREEMNA